MRSNICFYEPRDNFSYKGQKYTGNHWTIVKWVKLIYRKNKFWRINDQIKDP